MFACSTDIILEILDTPDPQEYNALSNIQFQENTVILHRDISQMPKRPAAWASWVYQAKHNHTESDTKNNIAVTYYMNNLQPCIPKNTPLFVTLNPLKEIPENLIFDKITLSHPVFTTDTEASQGKIKLLQGYKNCYYAGAWTGYGFHEDGIRSAVTIARLLGINIE